MESHCDLICILDFPGGLGGKASTYNAGDPGSVPGLGRSSGEGNGNPLQYSCLEIPWTEELGRLQSMELQRVGQTERLHFHFLVTNDVELFCICL